MFNKNIKLVIAALIIGAGVWQIVEGYTGNGIMLIFIITGFLFFYTLKTK